MKLNLKEDWKLLSKRAAIFYIVFTVINILTFVLLLTQTGAGLIHVEALFDGIPSAHRLGSLATVVDRIKQFSNGH